LLVFLRILWSFGWEGWMGIRGRRIVRIWIVGCGGCVVDLAGSM
jgi:hypothetical protein